MNKLIQYINNQFVQKLQEKLSTTSLDLSGIKNTEIFTDINPDYQQQIIKKLQHKSEKNTPKQGQIVSGELLEVNNKIKTKMDIIKHIIQYVGIISITFVIISVLSYLVKKICIIFINLNLYRDKKKLDNQIIK